MCIQQGPRQAARSFLLCGEAAEFGARCARAASLRPSCGPLVELATYVTKALVAPQPSDLAAERREVLTEGLGALVLRVMFDETINELVLLFF